MLGVVEEGILKILSATTTPHSPFRIASYFHVYQQRCFLLARQRAVA